MQQGPPPFTSSVLIVSYRRAEKLVRCLASLATQLVPPTEVLAIWQGDDVATKHALEAIPEPLPYALRVLHSPVPGVVEAENTGLAHATGTIILLCDDDIIAPPDWVQRHLAFYADPTIGAVGGPANNFNPDGSPFPKRDNTPCGLLTWYGKTIGNMYDQVPEWRSRPAAEVDHLVGYNVSFRRAAFDRFEDRLKPYWQLFELDACLQVKQRGLKVMFDFANVVDHYPTNTAYVSGRDGNLEIKIYNASFNQGLILAKHSEALYAPVRLAYLLLIGSVNTPGLLGSLVAIRRFGNPGRELTILAQSLRAAWRGWSAGRRLRRQREGINAKPVAAHP